MKILQHALMTIAAVTMVTGSAYAENKTHTENFEGDKRPGNWNVNNGHWEPANGMLVCRELEKDMHAASSRWMIPNQDCVIEAKLKFAGAKFFHIGFDPARGELKKKGHLYSLVLTPQKASIMKHKDKADPKSKNEVLGTANLPEVKDGWYHIRLETSGTTVMARVELGSSKVEMKVEDDTFGVKKPGIVFRTGGGDVHLDTIAVIVKK